MTKIVASKLMLAAMGAAALLGAALTAQAQTVTTVGTPQIKYDPSNSNPPIPAGLKVTCVSVPDDGAQPSKTCPVIYYGGYRTWIYSFIDNRVSFALVSYDAQGNVVQNVTRDGARYIFDAMSSDGNKTVVLLGQAKQYVQINWSDLPQPAATQ